VPELAHTENCAEKVQEELNTQPTLRLMPNFKKLKFFNLKTILINYETQQQNHHYFHKP
jgi:flavodoxin